MSAASRSGQRPPTPIELLRTQEKEQRYCNLCPRLCHHSCPVSNAERDEAVIPGHKNLTAGKVGAGDPPDEGMTDIFYKCADCRLCATFCEHDNDVSAGLMSARAVSVESGFEAPSVEALRKSFELYGNVWLEDLAPRLRELVSSDRRLGRATSGRGAGSVEPIKGRGLRVYWPGCAMIARRPHVVALTLAICDLLGEPDVSVYCGDEVQCCGYPLLAAGRHEDFLAQAKKASEALAGADMIFTGAPECAWTFKTAWPERAGVAPPALVIGHVVDLLLPALRHAPSRPPLELDAVYHDPCYLGRHLGRYDEPRTLVNRLLREPMKEAEPWARDQGYCCGAGGVLENTNPETASAITRARVGHLLGATTGPPGEIETGEKIEAGESRRCIVTACPKCETRFREAVGGEPKKDGAPRRPEVLDVVEVLARYLGLDEQGSQGASRREDDRERG